MTFNPWGAVLPPRLVVFDGVCNMCNGWVRFVVNRDPLGKIHFASAQSPIGASVLSGLGYSSIDPETIIYLVGDRVYERSSAILEVMRELHSWRLLVFLSLKVPRPFRDLVYQVVARNRYRLAGKLESCPLPPMNLRDRFLEEKAEAMPAEVASTK